MNFWTNRNNSPFSDIQRLAEGLSSNSSQNTLSKMGLVFNSLFQSFNQSLLLSNLYQQGFKRGQTEWRAHFKQAVSLLGPQGEIGKAIMNHSDALFSLDNLEYFHELEVYLKRSLLGKGELLKKDDFILKMPLLQCYFANLALCVTGLQDQDRNIDSWEIAFYQDDFYYYIAKNPILVICHNWLTYLKTNYHLCSRVLNVLEIIFLKDIATQLRQKEKVSINYAILHGIYVLSEWKIGVHHWEVLESISHGIDKRNNSASLLTLWIRLGLSIILHSSSLEIKSRQNFKNLQLKASPLSRKYFTSISEVQGFSFQEVDKSTFLNFLFQVESLIQKGSWQLSPLFLQHIFLLICITRNLIPDREDQQFRLSFLKKMLRNDSAVIKSHDQTKCFQIVQHAYQQTIPWQMFDDESDDDSDKQYGKVQRFRSLNRLEERERVIEDKGNRKSLKNNQGDISYINSWQKPVQSHESYILYETSKWLAYQVDKLRQSPLVEKKVENELPRTNLRFLASPSKFIFVVLLPLLFVYLILC